MALFQKRKKDRRLIFFPPQYLKLSAHHDADFFVFHQTYKSGGKQLWKNKASVRINIRDPFYLMQFHGTSTMNTFFADINSKWDNRRFIISFSYKFGKPLKAAPQRKHSASEDEQSRVKTNQQN